MELHSPTIGKITEAVSKAQKSIEGAEKDSSNPFHKSSYSSLASIWDAARKPLADNGLAVYQPTMWDNGELFLVTILSHSSGEYIKSFTPLLMKNKDSQSLGSAITYCRRYALASLVGICPIDPLENKDDDGETAMGRGEVQSSPVAKKKEEEPIGRLEVAELEKLIAELNAPQIVYNIRRQLKAPNIYEIKLQDHEFVVNSLKRAINNKKGGPDESSRVA